MTPRQVLHWINPVTRASGLWWTRAKERMIELTPRGVLSISTFVAFALSALSANALPVIIDVPTVQITSLGHRNFIDTSTGDRTISDGVDFACGSGEGTCSSSGFSAAMANGDEIIIRYEAPAGQRFHVFQDSALSSDAFIVFAEWVAANDQVHTLTHAVVNFENLSGTAPTETFNTFGVSDAGVAVFSEWESKVTGDFSFTALTFTFNVNNSPPGQTAIFSPVSGLASPSFGAGGTGVPTVPDQIQMQLEPVPEPSTALLLTAGVVGVAAMRRKHVLTGKHPRKGRFIMHRPQVYRSLFVLCAFLSVAVLAASASAVTIDLTSGTTGSIISGQSFNGENRAADVTVLGVGNQIVSSMTVTGVNTFDSSASVVAHIYDDSTSTAIATASVVVPVGTNQTITIPISATLIAGNSYRLAFFVPSTTSGNDAALFQPTAFGYTESQGLFRVNGGFDTFPTDVFPTGTNIFIPQISFQTVPEGSSVTLLAFGLAGLCLGRRRLQVSEVLWHSLGRPALSSLSIPVTDPSAVPIHAIEVKNIKNGMGSFSGGPAHCWQDGRPGPRDALFTSNGSNRLLMPQ